MKNIFLQIWNRVKNKYVFTLIGFAVLVLFLDENNLMVTLSLRREVRELKIQEKELQEGIIADSIQANALKSNLEAIERYGRETYYMKRADEDIYIIK